MLPSSFIHQFSVMPEAAPGILRKRFLRYVVAAIAIALTGNLPPAFAATPSSTDSCISIPDDVKRLQCFDELSLKVTNDSDTNEAAVMPSIWNKRIEADAARETFTLTARKPNYFTYSYSSDPNEDPYEFTGDAGEIDDNEIKFQLSVQTKLADDMFDQQADLWFSYTQVAYWQLFNGDISAPFRETNYEPEVYASFLTNYDFLGLTGRTVNLGIVHQSNGRSEPLSRSWNRIYAEFVFNRGDFGLSFKPWYRIEESSDDDDNPDIEDYMGNYEIRAYQQWNGHLFSAMLRNIFDSEDRYNSELQWSFPIQRHLRGLVQWYNGYGENMIDHDHKNNRIAIGILMTDWL
jgi:phospholipase A1